MTHVMPWAPGTKGTFLQLNAGAFWKRKTIADLKAIDVTDVAFMSAANDVPVLVYVDAYGAYRYSNTETSAEDGLYTIAPNVGSGRWQLVMPSHSGSRAGKLTAPETITAIVFASPKICKVTLDASSASGGQLSVFGDGLQIGSIDSNEKSFYLFDASERVDISSSSKLVDINDATYADDEWLGYRPVSVFVADNGNRLYATDQSNNIRQHSLGTPYVIATETQVSSHPAASSGRLYVSPDGTKMFTCSGSNIHEYTLEDAFDETSLTLTNTLSVSAQTTSIAGLYFSTDGTKMFVLSNVNSYNIVYEYDLETGFSTASADYITFFNVGTQTSNSASGLTFNSDGTKMFIGSAASDAVYQYSTSAWTITGASYDSLSLSIGAYEGNISSLNLAGDFKLYFSGANNNPYEFTIGTAFSGTARYHIEYINEV